MSIGIKRSHILTNSFVKLIEENHEKITEFFMNDLLKNPDTEAYRHISRDSMYESSDMVYRDLSQWIARDFSKKKIEERYLKIGRERYFSGIPFFQVQKALVLQKRHLWLFVMDKLYSDSTILTEALELNNRVTLYFDRAVYYILKAYAQ